MEATTELTAFALTLFAGLSTGIGSALAFFTRTTNTKFLAVSLGFSAGVMIYISFVELFIESRSLLISRLGSGQGYLLTVIGFFPESSEPESLIKLYRRQKIPMNCIGSRKCDNQSRKNNPVISTGRECLQH